MIKLHNSNVFKKTKLTKTTKLFTSYLHIHKYFMQYFLQARETTEQTDRQTKQPAQLACILLDLKCCGAWDTTICRCKAKNTILSTARWRGMKKAALDNPQSPPPTPSLKRHKALNVALANKFPCAASVLYCHVNLDSKQKMPTFRPCSQCFLSFFVFLITNSLKWLVSKNRRFLLMVL